MGYNKAREEKKWLKWKAAEEAQMREAGVDEKVIALLHSYDWAQFNADRRYYEHQADINGPVELVTASTAEENPHSVDKLLDEIDNEQLLYLLKQTEHLTLQIVLWKMEGYTSKEISRFSGLSESAINFRIFYLRKKTKKILAPSNN